MDHGSRWFTILLANAQGSVALIRVGGWTPEGP
jgi:hypothetical protein